MDDTKQPPGKPIEDKPSATESQTGHDTDGRSPDYDVSLETGTERSDLATPEPATGR